jgi:hypothetical protein
MNRWAWAGIAFLATLLASVHAPACSVCNGNFLQMNTFRQEADLSKLVLFGTAENPQLVGNGGTTDLRIEKVLRNDPFLGNTKVVKLPRFLPITDPKNPPRVLVFCDVFNNKLDIYRGVPCQSEAVVEYVKGALALDPKDRSAALLYFFRYLEHTEKPIAEDAFLEFAKANDQEIGAVAPKLDPAKLRAWVTARGTPAYRLNVYALMLGACGGDQDAALLRSMVDKPSDEAISALDGILAGYVHLRPKEGWQLAHGILADEKKSFPIRYAVLRSLRFYHGWKPQETRPLVYRGLELLVPQGDIADLAIEDLRRWEMWESAPLVLSQWGKKSHAAPIMEQTIVRYALCSAGARTDSAAFIAQQRKDHPDLVKDVEDSLKFDKTR